MEDQQQQQQQQQPEAGKTERKVEEEEEERKEEEEKEKVEERSEEGNREKGGNRKNAPACGAISSPRLKVPFEHGWKREIVYRAIVQPGSKTNCDVYYYAPDGKKLRSGREVSDYLGRRRGPLTSDNFTFFKAPLGVDARYESLRDAKQRRDDGLHHQKIPASPEKSLRARRRLQVQRNLQDLSQDVAAINETRTNRKRPSPECRKTRITRRSPKETQETQETKKTKDKENLVPAPARPAVPDDISHLFTPYRGPPRPIDGTGSHLQNLESINGKRFISIGTHQQGEDQSPPKRSPSPPDMDSPTTSPKRLKAEMSTPTRASSASGA